MTVEQDVIFPNVPEKNLEAMQQEPMFQRLVTPLWACITRKGVEKEWLLPKVTLLSIHTEKKRKVYTSQHAYREPPKAAAWSHGPSFCIMLSGSAGSRSIQEICQEVLSPVRGLSFVVLQVQDQPRKPVKRACVLHGCSVLWSGDHRDQEQSHGCCGEAGAAAGHP